LHSGVPPDDVVLCLSILGSSLIVSEEQPIDGVGVSKPTCIVIHEEYEWELEHQHSARDDSLPFEPHLFFPNIFGEPAIHDFACVYSSTDAHIVVHSQDSPNDGLSFNNGEDKLFIENPLDLSFIFFGSIEDEFVRFSSTPLVDSSDHEDDMKSLIFMIMADVIHLFPYLITIMNLSHLIF